MDFVAGVGDGAAERIRVSYPRGSVWVVEADIRDYFGTIDQQRLLALVAERVWTDEGSSCCVSGLRRA